MASNPSNGQLSSGTPPSAAGTNNQTVPQSNLATQKQLVTSNTNLERHRSNPSLAQATDDKKKVAAFTQAMLEKRRAQMDARHKYLLERFNALLVDVKPVDLETSFLHGTKLELTIEFFREGGMKKIFMFWQQSKVLAGGSKLTYQ
jgi:hypothetical protein